MTTGSFAMPVRPGVVSSFGCRIFLPSSCPASERCFLSDIFAAMFESSSSSWCSLQVERVVGGATTPKGFSFLSFRAGLRKAVLTCLGKESRGPYLEKSSDGGDDFRLNPGHCPGSRPSIAHHRPGDTVEKCSRVEKGDTSPARNPFTEAGPLVATKTVLIVKGKAGSSLHADRNRELVGAPVVVTPQQALASRPKEYCRCCFAFTAFLPSRPSKVGCLSTFEPLPVHGRPGCSTSTPNFNTETSTFCHIHSRRCYSPQTPTYRTYQVLPVYGRGAPTVAP